MKTFYSLLILFVAATCARAQNIGIGTATPNSSAILDVSSTTNGFLYPRMTTQQRSAIANPADGLHIYNTDMGAPEYYNGQLKEWMCICEASPVGLKVIKINFTRFEKETVWIQHGKFGIDTTAYDSSLLLITATENAILSRGIFFSRLSKKMKIILVNKGAIYGYGGDGGTGGSTGTGSPCGSLLPANGNDGGSGILSPDPYNIDVHNYGLIAGGGGGGAGGTTGNSLGQNGGGGGGGAGYQLVNPPFSVQNSKGGIAGSNTGIVYIAQQQTCGLTGTAYASPGVNGTNTLGGAGGNGISGGGKGGNGGDLGKPGQNTATAKGGKAGYCFYWPGGIINFYSYGGSQIIGPSFY